MLTIISDTNIKNNVNEPRWTYEFSFEIGKDDDHKSTVNAFAFGVDIHAVSIQGSYLEKAEHWKESKSLFTKNHE